MNMSMSFLLSVFERVGKDPNQRERNLHKVPKHQTHFLTQRQLETRIKLEELKAQTEEELKELRARKAELDSASTTEYLWEMAKSSIEGVGDGVTNYVPDFGEIGDYLDALDIDLSVLIYAITTGDIDELEELVNEGKVSESIIDDAVRRILRLKFRLGLFDDPFKYSDTKREEKVTYAKEGLDFAREIARESIVLLKNDRGLLPLSGKGKKRPVSRSSS